jgi:acyl-CoA synthetase (AMP-forming)/AMP-acid ligase II
VSAGNLIHRDEQGFFYLVDSVGDTFRWGGENISAAGIGAFCRGVSDAAVHGVQRLVPMLELLGPDSPAQSLRTNLPIVSGVVIPFLAEVYRARL